MSASFYRPTGSYFEKIHPVTKIIALTMAFIVPFLGTYPWDLVPYFVLLILAGFSAGGGRNLKRIWSLMLILFVMSVVLWTFFEKGTTLLVRIGPLAVKKESLTYGVTVGLRLNCFVVATLIFLTATPIEDFAYGLSRLGLPFVMSFALTLAFRLTPLFIDTGRTIVMAQKARGLDLDSGGVVRRIRHYIPIIVPILASGLRRSDQLAVALESKGFGRTGKRTVFSEYAVSWRDVLLLSVVLLLLLAMAAKRWLVH